MWIDDLTPYVYGYEPIPGRLAVGWLDPEKSFERGAVGPAIVQDRLEAVLQWAAAHRSVDAFRGRHACELDECSRISDHSADPGPTARFGNEQRVLGNAQIEVADGSGTTFVAPNLIAHYVEVHRYRPPEAFVRAALVGEWRRPESVAGSFRIAGGGVPIDDWSVELARLLWEHLAQDLGLPIPEIQGLVDVEVVPTEVSCRHTRARLPSIAVIIAPTATKWVKSYQWLPTASGTRDLARWIAESLTGAAR